MEPSFDLEILGLLNANILPISKNVGGAIAPPVPLLLVMEVIIRFWKLRAEYMPLYICIPSFFESVKRIKICLDGFSQTFVKGT